MRTQLGCILAIAGFALTTACAGGVVAGDRPDRGQDPSAAESSEATQQVTVTARDTMRFEPDAIVVTAGQPVLVTLRNEGRMTHDFVLSEGVARRFRIKAEGGETGSGTFTLDRPGTYTFICSVPGHESAGMKGTITAR